MNWGGESYSHKFPLLGALSCCKDVQALVPSVVQSYTLATCVAVTDPKDSSGPHFSLYLALASEVLPNQSQKVHYLTHRTVRSPNQGSVKQLYKTLFKSRL